LGKGIRKLRRQGKKATGLGRGGIQSKKDENEK